MARTDGRTDLLTGQTFFNEVKLQVLLLTKLKVVHNNTQYDIQDKKDKNVTTCDIAWVWAQFFRMEKITLES